MINPILVLLSLTLFLFTSVHSTFATRSLPSGVHPKIMNGEAVGTIAQIKGSGTLYFTNIGGNARLVVECGDLSEERARVNSLTCEGIDATGTFSGGPDGEAVFNTSSGEIRLQLTGGTVFSFSSQGFSMKFEVVDPTIFDAWVEEGAPRDSGARMSDISGQVEIACPPNLEAWDVMKMGRVIYVDCHIKTGEDSSATISFSDMTTFKMKAESEIVIDTPPEKDSKWTLLMGNIWVNVKKMVKDGTMETHMSQAVAGIKGTTFILHETGTESSIEVMEGKVAFKSRANGKELMVRAGESASATKYGLSAKKSEERSIISTAKNSYVLIITTAVLLCIIFIVLFLLKRKK